jgi:signal peptidase I
MRIVYQTCNQNTLLLRGGYDIFFSMANNDENKASQSLIKKLQIDKKVVYENIKAIGIAIFIVLIVRSSIVEAFKIPSGSMIPTLRVGDHIFVNKFAYGLKLPFSDFFGDKPFFLIKREAPKRGDVIVFIFPKNESFYYIKRVIGVPGDKVKVVDKVVYLNGAPLERTSVNRSDVIDSIDDQKYDKTSLELYDEINPTTKEKHLVMIDKNNFISENYGEITVPEEHLFVMGDNRDYSYDGRAWGFVPFKNVQGKAMVVWLSLWINFSEDQFLFRPLRIGTIIR